MPLAPLRFRNVGPGTGWCPASRAAGRPSRASLLAVCRTLGLTFGLVGCAVSPIVESEGGESVEVDGGWTGSEAPSTEDGEKNEPGDDPDADRNTGSTPPGDVTPKPDASAGVAADAGNPLSDSGARDAGSKDTGSKDAGAVRDAAIVDAGVATSAPVDSGTTTPSPTPTRDAGPVAPKPGSCRSATDCTESCVPIGILNCCRDNGTCGCTWAPGAYCQ